jgi:hypothetical protein
VIEHSRAKPLHGITQGIVWRFSSPFEFFLPQNRVLLPQCALCDYVKSEQNVTFKKRVLVGSQFPLSSVTFLTNSQCVVDPRRVLWQSVPWLKLLVAGHLLRIPGFDTRPIRVGFMTDNVELLQTSLKAHNFFFFSPFSSLNA